MVIAPGIALTTIFGSLYSSILKVLAALGHLARHDELFREFLKAPTAEAAHHLFGQIGVRRTDIDEYVHADEEFQMHCESRTRQYKNLAARGSRKHAAILRNPKIVSNGQWIGDIDEALSILAVGRSIRQVRHGKNQRILNRATVPLMFDTMTVGADWARREARSYSPTEVGYPEPLRDGPFDSKDVPVGGPYPERRDFPRPPTMPEIPPPVVQQATYQHAPASQPYPFWLKYQGR